MRLILLSSIIPLFMVLTGCAEPASTRPQASFHETPGQPSQRSGISATAELVEPIGVITLDQALSLALEHNPELKASSLDINAAEANRLQARLRPNPEIEVEVEEVGGAGSRSGFDGAENTVAIAQPIETGQKRTRRTTLASLEKELAEWDFKAKRLDVRKETTEAFVAVLAWQEKLALAEEIVSVAERAHNAVTQRVEAGRDSPIEQTKSAVALASVKIEPQRARLALESARKRLAAMWGAKSAYFDSVAGDFYSVEVVPSSEGLSNLIRHNPDVARWDTELEKSRAALELEKARAVSDVTLNGGWRYFNETDDSAAVFGLSIPLAVSDRNQGNIRRATYMLAKAQEGKKAAEVRGLASLEDAAQKLASAYAEATALKNEVLPGAQSSFEATSEGYRDGKFDYLQVLDAQRTLFEARGRYVESLAAYHETKATVERLIGQRLDGIENTKGENSEQQNGRTQ